jgi:hypothetical protein
MVSVNTQKLINFAILFEQAYKLNAKYKEQDYFADY